MKTPNELDKLIAKFCAPNDESDRPIHCAVVTEAVTPSRQRERRRDRLVNRVLEAIAKAEETALANDTPLPNKAQILAEMGVSSNTIHRYPELFEAYEAALERVGSRAIRRDSVVEGICQEIIKARDEAIANGEPMPTRSAVCDRLGLASNYISARPQCQALYEKAKVACRVALENRPKTVAPSVPDKSTIALNIEVSEAIYQGLQRYLERNTDWDSDRVAEAALALFLLQNRTEQGENRELSRVYLDSVFRSNAA